MSEAKHNHLVSNIPNTQENRDFVKKINKMSKKSDSIWKLKIRYRKPKQGYNYGSGGSLRRENATAFSVYVEDRRPYTQTPEYESRKRCWDRERELEKENKSLKKQLAIYKNPYIDWSISSINDEIFEIKECIIDAYLEDSLSEYKIHVDNHYGSITLKEKYNLLVEALEYAEKHD